MKKILLSIIFLFLFVSPVSSVTEIDGDLKVTYDEPLFPTSIIWYPGLTVTKSITVNNIGLSTHKAQITASDTSQTGTMANNLLFKVDTYFNDTMKKFWDNGTLNLSDIDRGGSTDYRITVTMPSTLGNEFQGKTSKFDLIVGFEGTDNKVTISGTGGACTDTKPGSAPTLTSATAGINSVVLNWSQASDPVSYYLVAYGVSPSNNAYGNPNVGGKGTTNYTVNNLSGSTSYCFIVRAGNGCAPGDFSNQICTTPSGGIVAGPATEFIPGVLGVATPSAKLEDNEGKIKGLNVQIVKNKKYWWLLAPIIFLMLFILYNRFRKK